MKKAKKNQKIQDQSIAEILSSRKISFKKMAKGAFIFNFGPMLVIFAMANFGHINPIPAITCVALFFLSSLIFLKPYIADLEELKNYVKALSDDKKPEKPSLSFLNNVDELENAIEELNKSWKKRSNNLAMLIAEVSKSQELMKDFVANASHEMKTPIASIQGFAETLLEVENEPEDIKKFLEIIKDQSNRLSRLVEDLLILSMVESGASKNDFHKLNIEALYSEALKSLHNLADEKSIEILLNNNSQSSEITGNKDEILRVIDNLLSNAIKYSDESSQVIATIYNQNNQELKFDEYSVNQEFLALEIKDNGEGISPENLDKIFQRFYRVDKERSRKIGGSGLGLSIVRNILKNHNAKILISSELDKGSIFTVYFPS